MKLKLKIYIYFNHNLRKKIIKIMYESIGIHINIKKGVHYNLDKELKNNHIIIFRKYINFISRQKKTKIIEYYSWN